MSLSASELARVVALGAPIICLDTCSVLDVMRDPTRETIRAHDAQAAIHLLHAVETQTKLIALLAEQVSLELQANLASVEMEAEHALAKLQSQMRRVDAVVAVFGASAVTNTQHLSDHVPRARSIVDRWIIAATALPQASQIASQALVRVNQPKTPAKKGKESMKDCVVIETYLEQVVALRQAGVTSKMVFASSNVKDYCGTTGQNLNQDIAQEFAALNIDYAPNLGAAKHLLGI